MLNVGSKREELGKNELFGLGAGAGGLMGGEVHRFTEGFIQDFLVIFIVSQQALKGH